MVQSVRGAVQIKADTPENIRDSVGRMAGLILSENGLSEEDLVNIQFSITPDLSSKNPAAALRQSTGGEVYAAVPLFCCAEPVCEGMLPRMVRTIITFNTKERRTVKPVYLDGAEKLRPDLFS